MPQEPTSPDGKVPIQDPRGGVRRVAPEEAESASHFHRARIMSEAEYNKAKTAFGKPAAPGGAPARPPGTAPQPPATPPAPVKPSAGLNQAGVPINAPGGAGTNYVTGPNAGPVGGAGTGTPPPEIPPGGPQSLTPGGRQQQTQQQQAAPTGSVAGQILPGIGKTVEEQAARLGGAFGVISPSMEKRVVNQPLTDVEQNVKDTTEFLEWMAVPMGHGAIDEGTAALVRKFVPQITKKGVVTSQILARIMYNTALGGEIGKLQGKDPATSAKINFYLSTLLEPMAKLSPMMLAKFLGVGAQRSGSLMETGEKMMDLSKYKPVFTRNQFANRAEKMYDQSVAETNALSQTAMAPGGQQRATASLRQMLLDVETAIAKSPVNQRSGLIKLRKEIANAAGTADRAKFNETVEEWKKQQAIYDQRFEEWQKASPSMQHVYMEGMSVASEKASRARRELMNLQANIDAPRLNELRRTVSDMIPWGKERMQTARGQQEVRNFYNKISDLQKQVVPGSAESIENENAFKDIWNGTKRPIGLTGYLHSLRTPESIPQSAAAMMGYHGMGQAFHGSFPAKLGGAILGSMAGTPATTAILRGARSNLLRGAAYGAAQQEFSPDQVPETDWSTKGKASPFTPE